ncbi:hypothetical protein L5515_009540 [Caenorhabditis briggsae]|uniref:Uncharacterized protein n=1 Tax=Caenorhabditis briggsae TaxID=6238 RepID=A0AAE9JP19_CAEBR|nr:hypothetical protein L5515_009540 [Caenorhabditis briggsae]
MNQLEYNPELEKVIYAQLALTGGCPKTQYISTDSLDIYFSGEGFNAPDLYGPAGSKCPKGRKATAKKLCAREKKTN